MKSPLLCASTGATVNELNSATSGRENALFDIGMSESE